MDMFYGKSSNCALSLQALLYYISRLASYDKAFTIYG